MKNCVLTPDEVKSLNNREISEKYIKKHNKSFYEFLNKKYGEISFNEKIYLYRNGFDIEKKGCCKVCGKPTKLKNKTAGYNTYCCIKCCNSDTDKKEKIKNTCLKKYGVDNPSQNAEIKNKKRQTKLVHFGNERYINIEKMCKTKLQRYGDEYFTNYEKIKHTKLQRYGDEYFTNQIKRNNTNLLLYKSISPFGNFNIIKKSRQTKLNKYGNENYNNQEKLKKTKLFRYCDEHYNNRNKSKETKLNRYGDEHYNNRNKSKETKLNRYGDEHYNNRNKSKETCLKKYGVKNFTQSEVYKNNVLEIQKKIKQTKDNNHTHNSSTIEEQFNSWLVENKINFARQYSSEQYPFSCDFYFPDSDLYFEINGHWTHGGHPFDCNNKDDLLLVEQWKSKGTTFYDNAIKTWTIRDTEKMKIATQNKLNYKVVYSCKLNDVITQFKNTIKL